ncbi:MAG: radical SAM protein [Oligoflexia bacterium]|nr:radical SAM protein [Oligoflexia bacterium]
MKLKSLNVNVHEACNSRCQICSIWKNTSTRSISLSVIQNVLQKYDFSELRDLSFTGGEAFLHKELERITTAFIGALPVLESFAITTNGTFPEKTRKYVEFLKGTKLPCRIAISLEGPRDVHNTLRGFACYDRVISSIQEVASAIKDYPLIKLFVSTTMTKVNANEESFQYLFRVCQEHGAIHTWRVIQQSEVYYKNIEEDLYPSKEQITFLIGIIKNYYNNNDQYYTELKDFLERGEISPKCSAGKKFGYLDCSGGLFPCPFINLEINKWNNESDLSKWASICSHCCTECRIYPELNFKL